MCCHFIGGITSFPQNLFLEKGPTKNHRWISKVLLRIEKGVTIRVSVPPVLVATFKSEEVLASFVWLWLFFLSCKPCWIFTYANVGMFGNFRVFRSNKGPMWFFSMWTYQGVFVWHFLTEIKLSRTRVHEVCLVEQQKHEGFHQPSVRVSNWTWVFRLICPILLKRDWQWLTLTS